MTGRCALFLLLFKTSRVVIMVKNAYPHCSSGWPGRPCPPFLQAKQDSEGEPSLSPFPFRAFGPGPLCRKGSFVILSHGHGPGRSCREAAHTHMVRQRFPEGPSAGLSSSLILFPVPVPLHPPADPFLAGSRQLPVVLQEISFCLSFPVPGSMAFFSDQGGTQR